MWLPIPQNHARQSVDIMVSTLKYNARQSLGPKQRTSAFFVVFITAFCKYETETEDRMKKSS